MRKLVILILLFILSSTQVFAEVNFEELWYIANTLAPEVNIRVDYGEWNSLAYIETDGIVIGLDYIGNESILYFLQFVNDNIEGPLPKPEVLLLLHELGHIKLNHIDCYYQYKYEYSELQNSGLTIAEKHAAYRNLTLEKQADAYMFEMLKLYFEEQDGKLVFVTK